MRTCKRCGQTFVVHRVDDRYCPPCHRDVTAQDAADAKRRAPRFPFSKDTTTWAGKGAAA